MSPTSYRARGSKQPPGPELKRSRSQGTQRKLVKASNVASTEDPNYSGGAVSLNVAPFLMHLSHPLLQVCHYVLFVYSSAFLLQLISVDFCYREYLP